MPTEPRGFFFRHVEKIVFGVVAAGFLVAAFFAVQRATISEEENPFEKIEQYEQQVSQKIDKPAPEVEPVDYVQLVRHRYEDPAVPPTMREWVMYPPLPRVYASMRVGTQGDYQVSFESALEEGSVRIQGAAVSRDLVQATHPVGNNYRVVQLQVGKLPPEREEIRFNVVARSGGQQHIRPVVIDAEVKGPAKPPIEFTATAELGRVVLEWQPNPENKGLEVSSYVIYRRQVSDVTSEWERIGEHRAGREFDQEDGEDGEGQEGDAERRRREEEERRRRFGPQGPGPAPGMEGMRGPGGRRPQGPKVTNYRRIDPNVRPEEVYAYRIRTRAQNSHPPLSDFTDVVRAQMPASVDFRFVRGAPGGVRVEVVKAFGRRLQTAEFDVAIGEQIGGIQQRSVSGRRMNFLTGCYLVDYHPRASKKVEVTREVGGEPQTRTRTKFARIIYQDQSGNLRVKWRKESESKLWEILEGPGASSQ